jgi:hypothetical protein
MSMVFKGQLRAKATYLVEAQLALGSLITPEA